MFITTTHPALRRNAYAHIDRSLERFLGSALANPRNAAPQYEQDDTAFHLSMDIPGLSREQLAIAIEGAVVRISSRDGAPRQYRAAYEMPQDIDVAASSAKLENGVLTLTLVKKVAPIQASELRIQ